MEFGSVTYARALNEVVKDDWSMKQDRIDERVSDAAGFGHPQKALRLYRIALLLGHPGIPLEEPPEELRKFYNAEKAHLGSG